MKTQSKHTPGPWELGVEYINPEWNTPCRNIYGPRSQSNVAQYIATVDMLGKDDGFANARLIAAAPDMLEALKMLVYDPELGIDPDGTSNEALEMAITAIAKAEGK